MTGDQGPMRGHPQIVHPEDQDWRVFLRLAAAEGWRVPEREIDLFTGALAGGAFVFKVGRACLGFVTTVAHQRSGWVGNLLVAPEARGRGIGARLFARACRELRRQGAVTLWLTASEQGRALYERSGFRAVDRVVRWVGQGGQLQGESFAEGAAGALLAADRGAWGESRLTLLGALGPGARIFSCGATVLMLQEGKALQVLGPWYSSSGCPRENRRVLTAALAAAGSGEVAADLLASSPLGALLAAAGFLPAGECALMAAGEPPAGAPAGLVALASLGSLG